MGEIDVMGENDVMGEIDATGQNDAPGEVDAIGEVDSGSIKRSCNARLPFVTWTVILVIPAKPESL